VADNLNIMMVANLALKYSLFAVFATLANLLAQEIFIHLYVGGSALIIAMAAGTVVGWVSKYLLDKHYIFMFETSSHRENLLKFLTYGLTGILTTSIFWSFELIFEHLFNSKLARYLGAVIGLSIGYVVKYHLDKRYVFLEQES
jgi:putative flippase GtrA